MFLMVCPFFDGPFVFLDVGPSFFVPCIPPFFGCFESYMIDKVSLLFLYMNGRAHRTGQ